jgi:cytosine/adenosine deaminase-related metal-dependent hydrolase
LQAIDGGTTTVADHAHMNYSESHSTNPLNLKLMMFEAKTCTANCATDATIASGIRSIFCYTPTALVKSWDQSGPTLNWDILADWVIPCFSGLSQKFKDHPLLTLGLAFDGYPLVSPDATKTLFDTARSLNCKVITSHYARNLLLGDPASVIKTLHDLNLLSNDCLISHATEATDEDLKLLRTTGASVSSTPVLELQMGLGSPMACRAELKDQMSLGCDSHSVVKGSMLDQMRAALINGRGEQYRLMRASGKFPKQLSPSIEEIFNLATINGARTLGMQDQIGRLAVGFKADIVIWETKSPSMVCAANQDPVAAIVTQAGNHDVEYVIINGNIRKEKGKLKATISKSTPPNGIADNVNHLSLNASLDNVKLPGKAGELAGFEWERIAEELLKNRAEINSRIAETGYDATKAKTNFMTAFGFDVSCLSD